MQLNRSLFVFFLLFLSYSQCQDLSPMIAVTGVGEVRARPDQAEITVGISSRNPNLDDVRNEVANTSMAIISYLRDQNINSDDIQTSFLSLQPFYSFEDDSGNTVPDYYIGQQSLTLILRNISNYDNIIQGLFEQGINTIDGITFKVSNETEYASRARSRAIQNAKNIGAQIANDFNVDLGRIYSITDQTNIQPPGPFPIAEASSSNAGPSIAAGQVVITSTVNVSWFIINQNVDDD